jgi:filamentous hemagglutinin
MHKKFTFGLIALLGVSLFIMGCDDSSDDSTQSAEKAAEELVKDLGTGAKVDTSDPKKVVLEGPVTTSKPVTVESGVTLVTGQNKLTVNHALTLKGTLDAGGAIDLGAAITIDGGTLYKAAGAIVLKTDAAKIAGGTAYDIGVGVSSEDDGTLTAGVAGIAFTATGIEGYDVVDGTKVKLADKQGADSAATLVFTGTTKGPLLTVKAATAINGVILDVATKGKIDVNADQRLTLTYSGASGVTSGGIFTKADGVSNPCAVKANAVQGDNALSPDTAVGVAGATIAASGTTTAMKATTPASGVITKNAKVEIDAEDEFAVAGTAITVTHS